MGAGDVLVMVVGDEGSGDAAPETIALDHLSFLPEAAPRVPRGHRLAEGSFCYGLRCGRIEVDFGGEPEPALRRIVNDDLASLTVKPPRR